VTVAFNLQLMIKRIFIPFACLLFFSLCAKAQALLNKDSLLKKIDTAKDDSTKVNLYYKLAEQYFKQDLALSEKYGLLGLALSKKIKYHQGVLDYYTNYSNILNIKGDFDSTLVIDMEALNYAKHYADSAEIGRTMLNVGVAYLHLQDQENALSYIEEAKDILNRNGVYEFEAHTLNLLQYLYHSMHQYRKGVNAGLEAVSIFEKSQDKTHLQQTYNNLGLNYIQLLKYDSAKYFLNKAGILASELNDNQVLITTNLNYALIALKQYKVDSLKVYLDKAMNLSRTYNAGEYKGLAYYGEAYYYLFKKDYTKAKLMVDSAILLVDKYNMRDVKQKIYAVQSALYYAMRDSKMGYYYFDQYELLNDSVRNESIIKNTISIEKKYETPKKEAQIRLQQSQLKQKSLLNYFLIGSAIALLAILGLSFRNYRSRQKLQQARIDELETEKQLTATEAVLKGEEQERTRLAKDLHDGLGGMLSGIKYSLSNMKGNLIMTPDNAQAFERSIDMLDSSIKEMRRVAHNMMPEILVRYGLDTALKDFCNEIDRSGVIRTSYQSIGMDKVELEQTASVTIYRIVQELVNNVIKHARAKTALVQLHYSGQEKLLAVTVEDDGKGFDAVMLERSDGIGWSNIRNRVEFLKGKIDIKSAPGKGTSVLIEIGM